MKRKSPSQMSLGLLVLLTLSACGKENKMPSGKDGASVAALGSWSAEQKRGERTERARITFEASQVTISNTCTYPDGLSLNVETKSPVTYGPNQFTIPEGVTGKKTEKGRTCKTGIEKGTYRYTIDGRKMTVVAEGEKDSVELTREE